MFAFVRTSTPEGSLYLLNACRTTWIDCLFLSCLSKMALQYLQRSSMHICHPCWDLCTRTHSCNGSLLAIKRWMLGTIRKDLYVWTPKWLQMICYHRSWVKTICTQKVKPFDLGQLVDILVKLAWRGHCGPTQGLECCALGRTGFQFLVSSWCLFSWEVRPSSLCHLFHSCGWLRGLFVHHGLSLHRRCRRYFYSTSTKL